VEQDFEQVDLKEVRNQIAKGYLNPILFTTKVQISPDTTFHIWARYHCLLDSTLTIPGKFMIDDTTKPFKTYQFAEEIIVATDDFKTILAKDIKRADFVNHLPEPLNEYGVLREPTFEGFDKQSGVFNFHFSVSIPATDLGVLVLMKLNRNGKAEFTIEK